MKNTYDIPDYNKYLSLKVSPGLWLVLLYLLRPYLIVALSVVNPSDRMELINMFYQDRLPMFLSATAAIPAALLVFAWLKRLPGANDLVRAIWANGRLLLGFSALLNCITAYLPIYLGVTRKLDNLAWLQLGLSVLVIFYILLCQRVKDTFADFPEENK